MKNTIINTLCYFDGQRYHDGGPYQLLIKDGVILSVRQGAADKPVGFEQADTLDVKFLMPGLVEAHCHLFLNGGELDFKTRRNYLKAPLAEMMQTAHDNVNASLSAGITLIRDAGDRYGVNHRIRAELSADGKGPVIRSPGLALRQTGRYGAFMAKEISSPEEICTAIDKTAQTSDDLKILLTGIMDLKAGAVTKQPQFDLDSLKLMVAHAARHKIKTFVHCSGLDGLILAVDAGVHSIEHGFFMNEDILDIMAEKEIAWVPTFSPLHFQWAQPELAGWDENTIINIRQILDNHLHHLEIADRKGVQLIAGSDAGSYGVSHGSALVDELYFFLEAGLPMAQVLKSATSRPRRLWGCKSSNITENNQADLVILGASPFEDKTALRDVRMVLSQRSLISFEQAGKGPV